ncbi:MAG TPA: DUF6623 family protein [Thermoanaerobaculia bacterium]
MNRRDLLKQGGLAAVGLMGVTATAAAQTASPAALHAVWVHGSSVEVEDTAVLNATRRLGWGTVFSGKPGKFAWFHINIPTPVIVNDVRAVLEKVFIFYKTDGASIRNVHFWDGPHQIKAFDGLMLTGDRSGGIVATNSWAITPAATMRYGLGLSIGVQYSIGFDSAITTDILFTTAGADFRLATPAEVEDRVRMTPPVRRVP